MRARAADSVARLLFAVALLLATGVVRAAPGDLPGDIPLVAAGDGHLWWVVEATESEADARGAAGRGAAARAAAAAMGRHLVMHHALVEPAPTERLVMRLAQSPEAIAADGNELVLVMRPEGAAGRRLVMRVRAERNAAVGHWYTAPREGPEILPPLRGDGTLHASVLVEGRFYALLRLAAGGDRPGPRWWFGSVPAGSAGAPDWTEHPPPTETATERIRLLEVDGAPVAMRSDDRAEAARGFRVDWIRWTGASWIPGARAPDADAGGSGESAAVVARPAAPDATTWTRGRPLGAFTVDARLAIVHAGTVEGGEGGDGEGETDESDEASSASIAVDRIRRGVATPWSRFEAPVGRWALAPFGDDAALLTLDDAQRASVALLAPSAAHPATAVALAPPGFAASRWVHLPILGVVSIAFVLVAVIFGSDAYLANRRLGTDGAEAPPAPERPRGAPLGQRALAMAVDLVPGVVVAWILFGGNPIEFLRFPVFIGDLSVAKGALVACATGWAWAFAGDVLFGRSLGKRLLGLEIRVARGDGRGGAAGVGRRALRGLLALVAVASPPVMLLAFLHPFRDGPAEMLSGTTVVDGRDAGAATGEVGAD